MGWVSAFRAEHYGLPWTDWEPTDTTLSLRSGPIPRSDFFDTCDYEPILGHCSTPGRFRLPPLLIALIKTYANRANAL